MRKEKFFYNTQTLRYEKVVEPWSTKLLRVVGFVCAAIVSAFALTMVSHKYFPSPQEKELERELSQMRSQYSLLGQEVARMEKVLDNVKERDVAAYRMIFGMDPIDENVWNGGVGGHNIYGNIIPYENSGELLKETQSRISKLRRQLTIQSKSLDTVLTLATEKEAMLASIPSIKPVRSDKLKRQINLLSGYGMRFHPIHKVRKMHYGIDFTAPKGTLIQATGDGVVERVERRKTGYGNNVIIDHGYGYQTLYAHLSKVDIKVGQKVKKGQQIGTVGSTGTSTAPHCHYEVHFKGKKVNPINYCMDGLTKEEYQQLVNAASITNQSFD